MDEGKAQYVTYYESEGMVSGNNDKFDVKTCGFLSLISPLAYTKK